MTVGRILFGEAEIASQVSRLARKIACSRPRPELLCAILNGAFVFAADLARALSRAGLDLPVEFLRLSRYGGTRAGGEEIAVVLGPDESVRGRHILLVDAVLDHGHTLAKARQLLEEAGAASIRIAVAVDKRRPDALIEADYAAFLHANAFIVGYGMDDAGAGRGLPYIAIAR